MKPLLNFLKKNFPLILVVVLGAILRFYKLSLLPPSLNWDEASHGVNAYSLLKTGRDEWGLSWPLIFRAFGDYKLPVYIYTSILPIWIFGLNAFAIRFVSALAGTLAIFGLYLLVRQLFSSPKLALISAFLLAISPWHFFISRPALEANLSLTLIIFGFYYLIKFFKSNSSLLPAVILLGLSLHTYNTARVFVPLLVLFSFFIYKPKIIFNSKTILSLLLAFFFSSLVAYQVFAGEATARYSKLQILTENTVFQIGESRSESKLPAPLPRLIHNRPVFFTKTVLSNYLKYFSPQFFTQTSGSQSQFAIPGQNMLTLPVEFLAILGFIFLLLNLKGSKTNQFILFWFLLSPVAASLTADPPQALRPNPMIPALIILATLGLFFLQQKLFPKFSAVLAFVFLFGASISFSLYLYQYITNYQTKYSQSWQYGYQEAIEYLQNNQLNYDKVFVTKRLGEPHIFYSFFTKLNPSLLQPNNNNIRFNKSDWYWTDKIADVYFLNDWTITTGLVDHFKLESGQEVSVTNSLLITSPDHVPANAKEIKVIKYLDGTPALIITSIR